MDKLENNINNRLILAFCFKTFTQFGVLTDLR